MLSFTECAHIIIVITFFSLAFGNFFYVLYFNERVFYEKNLKLLLVLVVDLSKSARIVFAFGECASVRLCVRAVCVHVVIYTFDISSVFTPKKQIAQFPSISLFFRSRVIFLLACCLIVTCAHSFLSRARYCFLLLLVVTFLFL